MRHIPFPKIPSLAEWNSKFRTKSALVAPRATLANVNIAGIIK